MDKTKWSSLHAISGHLGLVSKSLDTTHSRSHMPHHQILHHGFSTMKVLSFTVRISKLPHFESTVLAFFTQESRTPSSTLQFSSQCYKTPLQLSLLLLTNSKNNIANLTLGPPALVANCLHATLAKKKKAFQSGRPTVSFVDSPFRPMLNILARMIFQLIPVACPNHFASGDVYTLLDILRSAPVDADLILVNQDLAGFFTSIDQERFIGSWLMLLNFLRRC